jgi:CHAT domain-containing protein
MSHAAMAAPAVPAEPGTSCSEALESQAPLMRQHVTTVGIVPFELVLTGVAGHEYLLEVREQGNDVAVDVRDGDRIIARADHPERRTGTRRTIVAAQKSRGYVLRISGKEHAGVTGTAEVRVFDVAGLSKYPACLAIYRWLAAADSDYADGQEISLGHSGPGPHLARHSYLRAAEGYRAVQSALRDPADAQLRGETALALAAIYCFNLLSWPNTIQWAAEAERILVGQDPYRVARAQALSATASLEAAAGSTSGASAGSGDARAILERNRRLLERLVAFHSARHESYDAALLINYVGLSYLYEGRYRECAKASLAASRAFGAIGEVPRKALAWQNRGLCFWGLGHLPDALRAFNRALEDLGPGSFPPLYLMTLNNAALANYALGQFDEALRLYDRALTAAARVQARLDEARSLYGIGVTYYALGDRELAAAFLEHSLSIRTVALNARDRVASLRALATIYADRGDLIRAIDADRETFTLATAPSARARIRVQLASHLAATGRRDEALRLLEELLARNATADALVRAQALVRRAVIRREAGTSAAALRDLDAALPAFRRFGSVTDEFGAQLERARVLRALGRRRDALAAVEAALGKSEAIRTQTANPELRAQLQAPLRPAHDLKLDLLWEEFDAATQAGDRRHALRVAARALDSADESRARSFADVAAQEFSPAIRHQLGPDLAHRSALYREIAGRRFALAERRDRSGADDLRAHAIESELAGLEREIDTVNNVIAARTPTRRASDEARSGNPSTAPLPSDTAIIVYWLGADRSYGWAVTPVGVQWARLAAPATVTAAARAFHHALTRFVDLPPERRREAAAALYAEVIAPLEPWIAPYRRWLVVPDGALSYVPIGALHPAAPADAAYIVESHDVALAPAVWVLRSPYVPKMTWRTSRVLLVSDPVYEVADPRLAVVRTTPATSIIGAIAAESSPGEQLTYRRIRWTGQEAQRIAAEFPSKDVDQLTGLSATREHVLSLDWSQYRFIHIASHGRVDAKIPQLSALILGAYDESGRRVDPALRAADLSLLTLHADVVVFSGCDTALGKEVLNEGLVGLSYATLARGAHAVISSLWQVPDESGATLMTEFYSNLLHHSLGPPEALAAAMRSVLKQNPSSDPALWAPFQVSVATMDRAAGPMTSVAGNNN